MLPSSAPTSRAMSAATRPARLIQPASFQLRIKPSPHSRCITSAMRPGVARGSGHGRDLLGHPFLALAWLAGSGAAREFGGLRAGQVVWLGSVTPPIWLDGPCGVEVEFGGFGVVGLRFA